MKRRRLEQSKRFLRFASWMVVAPFLANSAGWIFTEIGRQPWVVFGLLKTSAAVTLIAPGYVATSLIGFTAVYTLLAVVEIGLMIRLAKVPEPVLSESEAQAIPELIY
jgi:cytochrome d ubiquinol oxidase subunit I